MRIRYFTFLAVVLPAASAWAQQPEVQTAKNHFDDGQNLYLQGKFDQAAEKFRLAFEARPYPAFVFNMAVCYEKDRDYVKALSHYERFLTADPHTPDRKLVQKRIAAIRRHLNPPSSQPGKPGAATQPARPVSASLPPIETKGLVVIESAPEGAAIYLNDKSKGIFTRTPYTGSLPPGQHTAIIELKDYRTERKTFLVRNDRLSYLYFGLSVEKNLGWLEVQANIPGASVYIDSKTIGSVGQTPYSGNQRPGRRKVIVERVGYDPAVKWVDIVAGKNHMVNVQLQRVSHGFLKVTGRTTRGATVKVDGKLVTCSEHPCEARVSPGPHRVLVERDGFKDYEQEIQVIKAEEVKLAVRLNPSPPRYKAYVSFGVAAALLAGGITTGVMSNNRYDAIESDINGQRMVDSDDPRYDEGKVLSIVANSMFGLSGVVGVLGVYYLLRNEGPDSYGEATSRKLTFAPSFGPRAMGVEGRLRF